MTDGDHQTHQGKLLLFTGQVAVITGAARGLGREYALLLASRGAAVVVNDLGGGRDGSGQGSAAADEVVAEIIRSGGVAVADYHSVEEGHKIVQTAIEKFGRIDILINNAGILRDRSMMKITEEDWDLVQRVHLRGAFLTTRAAWPHFRDQQYGRIVMTSSPSGLYGNFGQANYSSAKLGLLSLAKTLAVEGLKYNIKANTIIPVAASRLTEDLLPEDLLELFAPRYVAPMVAYLVHESCPANGEVFEAAGGFYGRYRWQRSSGKVFNDPASVTLEAIRDAWQEVVDMNGKSSSPTSMQEHTFKLISQLRGEEFPEDEEEEKTDELKVKGGGGEIILEDPRRSSSVVTTSSDGGKTLVTTLTPQDVILYALSVGVSTSDPHHLQYLYEADEHFTALPTLGASLSLNAVFETNLFQEAINRYSLEDNFIRTLHGEQYLKLVKPIPTSGQLVSKPRIVDVLDKGSGALILIEVPTYNSAGELLFLNQLALFMLGSGNFEGGRRTSDYPALVEAVEVPSDRPPDAVVRQVTSVDQAATFRLVGDSNPLHIDPTFSVIGGFERPILHGLCLLGFAVRAALREFAGVDGAAAEVEATAFDAAKARFTGAIIPGQTIETRLWRGGSTTTAATTTGDHHHLTTRIHFECYALETGSRIISSAFVDLKLPPLPLPPSSSAAPLAAGSSTLLAAPSPSPAHLDYQQISQVDKHLDSRRRHSATATSITTGDISSSSSSSSSSAVAVVDTTASTMAPQAQLISPEHCKIDAIFGDGKLREQIRSNPSVVASIGTVYQFNVSAGGQPVSVWTLDLKNAPGDIYRGSLEKGIVDCTLTVEDEVITDIFTGKEDALKAFMDGRLKVTGNILAASKLQQIFADNLTKKNGEESTAASTSKPPASAQEDQAADQALLDSVPISGLKSDIVFTLLRNRMHEEPDFIRRIRASYQFNITLNGKLQATWTAENKTEVNGCCYSGPYRNGKADCIVTVEDEDFIKLMFGKLNPQRAFMLGKLKVKGNIMLLQKLNSLWLELLKSGKAPEFPYIMELMSKTDLIPGLRSEVMVIELVQRLIRLSYLCTEVASLVGFEVLKSDGKVGAQYTLDFTKTKVTGVFERGLPPPDPKYCVLTMSDEDFCRLTNHKFTLVQAIEAGRVQVRGDPTVPPKIGIIFSTPTSRVKL